MRVTPHRSSGNLIGPRRLSTEYHEASSSANLQTGVNLITMEFGQFISHDVNRNTVSRGKFMGSVETYSVVFSRPHTLIVVLTHSFALRNIGILVHIVVRRHIIVLKHFVIRRHFADIRPH